MNIVKAASLSAILTLCAVPAVAQCAPPNSAGGGVAGGAIAGAVGGAVIGGPVGAAVGAVVGGAAGGATAAAISPTACTYVYQQDVPVVTVPGEIVVGQPLPQTVTLHKIPQVETYQFARVNGKRVLIDPRTRTVVQVLN